MSPPVLTVSELNQRARACLEAEFPLLWIAGETSNLVRASSGHAYFSLKDETAQVRCVMFRNRVQGIPWQLANGQQVEVLARVTMYEARGDFQLNIEGMRRAGLGRLYEAFARLKGKLESEGLFAPERKRAIPSYPRQIGVITSPQAAALRDVLTAMARRAVHVPLVIYPTLVQGAEAANAIAGAIAKANHRNECELLLLVRGGGSIEDLWAFNEEATARAIAHSRIPVISGIGHETDLTIADLVADLRAATPTAAAEIATAHWFGAQTSLETWEHRLSSGIRRRLNELRQRLDMATSQLLHPAMRLARNRDQLQLLGQRLRSAMQRKTAETTHRLARMQMAFAHSAPDIGNRKAQLSQASHRLEKAGQTMLERYRYRIEYLAQGLDHLNPGHTLARGYAIVRDENAKIITSASDVNIDARLAIELGSGTLHAKRIADKEESAPVVVKLKPD